MKNSKTKKRRAEKLFFLAEHPDKICRRDKVAGEGGETAFH